MQGRLVCEKVEPTTPAGNARENRSSLPSNSPLRPCRAHQRAHRCRDRRACPRCSARRRRSNSRRPGHRGGLPFGTRLEPNSALSRRRQRRDRSTCRALCTPVRWPCTPVCLRIGARLRVRFGRFPSSSRRLIDNVRPWQSIRPRLGSDRRRRTRPSSSSWHRSSARR